MVLDDKTVKRPAAAPEVIEILVETVVSEQVKGKEINLAIL